MTPGAEAAAAPSGTDAGGELGWHLRALHVFILSGFAVAQPVLDLAGRHANFFVAHDSLPMDLVALAAVLCLGPPALLFLAELIPGILAERAGRSMHSVLLSFLAAGGALPFLRRIDAVPGWLWLPVALLLGIAAAAAYDRYPAVRAGLTWFWPAPLMFAAAFLFLTPVKILLFPAPYVPAVEVEVKAETPVVVVVFDELSLPTLMDENREIDADRYPNFAALSRRGHWFRNATTTAAYTPMAVPALLSGRLQGEAGGNVFLATAEHHPRTLFSLLAPEYQLNVFETMTNICPREVCGATPFDDDLPGRLNALLSDLAMVYPHAMLPADVANELPDISNQWRGFTNIGRIRRDKGFRMEAGKRPRIFADFLASLHSGQRKTLHFLHWSMPHAPWRYTPAGKHYEPPGGGLLFKHGLVRGVWDGNDFSVLQGFQRYLLQLAFTDRLLGDLITTLEEAGLWDEALLVVAADHGVSFHANEPRRQLRPGTFIDVLPVPLFIKLPNQREGVTSDRNVELIDVMPTIAAILGLDEEPWAMDGESIFDPAIPERRHKTVVVPPYKSGSLKTFELAAFEAKYLAVERMLELFGRGDDPLNLYRIGPHAELIGRPVVELEVAAEADGVLHLERPDLYDDVDPESDFLPARIVGEIHGHRRQSGALDLAVAIDGTVWAMTRTFFSHRSRARFTAMVPDGAFSPGRNIVQVFVLEGDDDRPVLSPTRRPAPRRFWSRMLERFRR